MRGQIPKVPNFLAIRNQQPDAGTALHSEKPTTSSTNTPATVTQPKRSSDRNRRSPSYYGFESPSPDSTILPPPKRPRQAGDVKKFQPPLESIVEPVQHIAESQPEESNISPQIGDVSPPASRNISLLDKDTPTLVQSLTEFEAENTIGKNGTIDTEFIQTVTIETFHNLIVFIFSYDNQ